MQRCGALLKTLGGTREGAFEVATAFAHSENGGRDGDPTAVHNALCRATVRDPWIAALDPDELLLEKAHEASWEAQVLERRRAALVYSQFAGTERCPRCGAVGVLEFDEQTRGGDESTSRVRVFSCKVHVVRLA